jgi:hypothetical protein
MKNLIQSDGKKGRIQPCIVTPAETGGKAKQGLRSTPRP